MSSKGQEVPHGRWWTKGTKLPLLLGAEGTITAFKNHVDRKGMEGHEPNVININR